MKKIINLFSFPLDQRFLFLISGAFQYLLDVIVYSILVLFLPNILLANSISKFSVGLSGFFVNGIFVFKKLNLMSTREILISLGKFLILLLLMTLLGNKLISLYDGESYSIKVFSKIVSEMFLAIISFFIQKVFVYKKINSKAGNS